MLTSPDLISQARNNAQQARQQDHILLSVAHTCGQKPNELTSRIPSFFEPDAVVGRWFCQVR